MKKATVENGVIECVDLLFEDHGCLVLNIGIKLQNGGYVTFGNTSLGHKYQKYELDGISKSLKNNISNNLSNIF